MRSTPATPSSPKDVSRANCSTTYTYVHENDPTDHEPPDPSLQPQWQEILAPRCRRRRTEPLTIHDAEAAASAYKRLERLSAEYDYLAQIAAAEDLTKFLKVRGRRRLKNCKKSHRGDRRWQPGAGPRASASRAFSGSSPRRWRQAQRQKTPPRSDHTPAPHFLNGMPTSGSDPLTEPIHSRGGSRKHDRPGTEQIETGQTKSPSKHSCTTPNGRESLIGISRQRSSTLPVIGGVATYRTDGASTTHPFRSGLFRRTSSGNENRNTKASKSSLLTEHRPRAPTPEGWLRRLDLSRSKPIHVGWQLTRRACAP